MKEVGLPSDMNNSHMLSIIEQKMCADDRKVWARDLEKEKKPATLEALMNWMNVEMKSRMRATAPIRVGSSGKRPVYHCVSLIATNPFGTNVGCAKLRHTGLINARNSYPSVLTTGSQLQRQITCVSVA